MKSKLEQFNLIEVSVDDTQLREQGEQIYFILLLSSHYSAEPADDLTEQANVNDIPEYPTQDEEEDDNPTSEGLDQGTIEQQTDGAGSSVHVVDRFDEGESSNQVEPEWAQPGDEESTAGPLSGDEHTEHPDGVAEDDREQRTGGTTVSDNGYPVSAEDLDTAAIHEHSDVHTTPPLGENSTEYEEVVATNEDYEADYNEDDPDSEPGEAVTIEGDARDGDWETTASDAQQTRDDLEQHEVQHEATGMGEREQVVHIAVTDNLTLPTADSDTIDLTTPGPDDDPIATQQGRWPLPAVACLPSNLTAESDTDSIGRQTLDEFADAQEGPRDDHRPHKAEELNGNTGECLFSGAFPLTLTQPLDQLIELIPDVDQFGDDFNWDEEFGGDFDDGEFGELEDQSNVETKPVDSQEPISGRSSKRGFDEIDSDTADEEQVPGDVSPSKFPSSLRALRDSHGPPLDSKRKKVL